MVNNLSMKSNMSLFINIYELYSSLTSLSLVFDSRLVCLELL